MQMMQRGRQVAQLALVSDANRPANLSTAKSVLIALKADASTEGLKAYATKVAGMSTPEPWAAFMPGGPGDPPAAVLLLRPEPEAPSTLWNIFDKLSQWTGPGQIYKIVYEGKLPTNPLMDASQAVTGPIVRLVAIAGGVLLLVVLLGVALWALTRSPAPAQGAK